MHNTAELGFRSISIKRFGRTAVITLSAPPANAISSRLICELSEALDQIESDKGVDVICLKSSGKMFSAGAELNEIAEMFSSHQTQSLMAEFVQSFQSLNDRLASVAQITVAEITGAAIGGGLELALACDFRHCTESATFGLPEALLGLIPAAGGTHRLPSLTGLSFARRLILTGKIVSAQEALSAGLVDQIVESEDDFDALVQKLLRLSPEALTAAKHCLALDPKAASKIERDAVSHLTGQADTRQRISNFLAKSAARNP